LCVLAQCSKTLNRIATPHLYANVTFREAYRECYEPAWPFLLPFAWLVFTSAQHAKYVRSLAVQVGGEEHPPVSVWDDRDAKRPWLACSRGGKGDGGGGGEEENAQMVKKVLKGVCAQHTVDEKDADELFELVKGGDKDIVVVALVVAHLHNLRTLDFCYGDIGGNETLMRVLDLITRGRSRRGVQSSQRDQPLPFSAPLDIMVSGAEDKYPNEALHVAAFLNLPNIRSLYAWKAGDQNWTGDDSKDDAFFRLKPRSCAVEYMELRSSKLYHEHFHYLMNALIPQKLKTFIYEVGCTWAWVNVHHRKIMDSLAPHYDTLECLELSHEDFYPYQFDNDAEEPLPVSFQGFKTLKKLKVAPVYIWGGDVLRKQNPNRDPANKHMLRNALPGTLEELWITRVDTVDRNTKYIANILIPALRLLVEHRESIPQLTQLYCTFCRKGQSLEWLNDLHSFSLFAKNHGITVRIRLMNDCMDIETERRWGWDETVEWEECIHNPGNNCPSIALADQDDLWETLKGYRVEIKSEGNNGE
jgi:hypothetical protein